jgi:SAM-dependent methyltransferase
VQNQGNVSENPAGAAAAARDAAPIPNGPLFRPVSACWVCGGADLVSANDERLELMNLVDDPDTAQVMSDYHGRHFVLNRCRGCGFMQPADIPTREGFFDALYALKWSHEWMVEEFTSTQKDAIFQEILLQLARRLPLPGRSLLDVGAHLGRMMVLARDAGWQAEGIELNPRTAAFAAMRTGLPVHLKNARAVAETGVRYDAVVLTDVLEHIPEPLPVLRDLRRIMKPGGWLAVKVPRGRSQLLKQRVRHALSRKHDPGIATNYAHVNHFGVGSLRLILRRAGFESVLIGPAQPELSPGAGGNALFDRFVRRAVRLAALSVPYGARTPLAMNLQAYARNPAER